MNSWDNYYRGFQSKLLRDRRLILSLKDNEESKKLLNNLGYKFDPEVEVIDNCKIGGYYFWQAYVYLNYDDEDEEHDENDEKTNWGDSSRLNTPILFRESVQTLNSQWGGTKLVKMTMI